MLVLNIWSILRAYLRLFMNLEVKEFRRQIGRP